MHPNGMAALPKHRPLRLIPPTQHQVDVVAAAINLQLQVPFRAAFSLGIAAFDPHIQIIQNSGS
jgi:hypothetical protein